MKNIENLLKRAKLYGISKEVLEKIIERDKVCIYCRKEMKRCASVIGTPKNKATIEHFSDVGELGAGVEEVGICCGSCNSSRGNKKLFSWFKKDYCIKNNINEKKVAKPIKNYIKKMGKKS